MVSHADPSPPSSAQPVTFTIDGIVRGIRRIAPLSAFALPFGVAYGAASVEQGMAAWQALLASGTIFAGASQFAALELWQDPMPLISITLVVLAVNARHIILGAALSPWLNRLPPGRWFLALCMLTDVTFADSHAAFKGGERDAGILLGGGLLMWTAWMIGTTIGAIAGTSLGDLDRFGLDVVMMSFFAAIVVGSLKSRAAVWPVIIASLMALATLPLLPAGWNIIVAALVGGGVGALRRD